MDKKSIKLKLRSKSLQRPRTNSCIVLKEFKKAQLGYLKDKLIGIKKKELN